jgi:hypothetical protein
MFDALLLIVLGIVICLSAVGYYGYLDCELGDPCILKRLQWLLDAHEQKFEKAPWYAKPAWMVFERKCDKAKIDEYYKKKAERKETDAEGDDESPAAPATSAAPATLATPPIKPSPAIRK